MTNKDRLNKKNQYACNIPSLGFDLDLACMNFTEDFLASASPKVARALDDLRRLEAGEEVNTSEKRMVGHYWLRNPKLAPSEAMAGQITSTVQQVKDFAAGVLSGRVAAPTNEGKFKNLLIIGIGGSTLGPQLVYRALGKPAALTTYFFDNTDPEGMLITLRSIPDLAATLVLVISKSGGTPETYNGQFFAWNYFKSQGLTPPKNFVAITGEGSKLDRLAQDGAWLARFPMWDWVGGRTSIWSAVGLLPAALQGADVGALLAGACEMDIATRQASVEKNPALLLALMWGYATNWRGEKALVVLPYKDRLSLLASYLQQLMMESLGKEKDNSGKIVNQGILVLGNKGSSDQHSYVQQLRDGLSNFFVHFVNVLEDSQDEIADSMVELEPGIRIGDYLHSFLIGTRAALINNGRESLTINLQQLNESSFGALIALFERAVTFYASMVEINAYDQPGVEAGKVAAARVLDLQKKIMAGNFAVSETPTQIAAALQEDDVYLVAEILAYLRANRG